MNHFISTTLVLMLSLVGMSMVSQRLEPRERPFVWASFAAHVMSLFALLWLYTFFYDGGDITTYGDYATRINTTVRADLASSLPELVRAFMRWESTLDPLIYSAGSSTGAMSAATALGFLLTGDSLVGCCALFAMMSFSSKIAIYVGLRRDFHRALHIRLLVGVMLVPSAIFWTAGVVKEALAMFGLGWCFLGLQMLRRGEHRALAVALLVLGGLFVLNIKPYIALPMSVAYGVYYASSRMKRAGGSLLGVLKSPVYLLIGTFITAASLYAIGELFPRFSINQIAEEAAHLQSYSSQGVGGSTFAFGSGDATTLSAQLTFVPVAMINSLFRPFIFEVHNAVALINGLETAVISLLMGMSVYGRGAKDTALAILKVPALTFCVLFVLLFGIGVGLGTTNLGTLSRYRVPMMPFYVSMLLLLVPYGSLPIDRGTSHGAESG